MCGINGFNWDDKELTKQMNELIKHRGPDGKGTYTDDLVSLGHVRLAILDLSEKGKQPMGYEHNYKKVIIIHNGEVYNFLELRKVLEERGYKFKSNTDTEVILASYLEWGFDCVNKFNGMWAFCIYDLNKKILFCSRDRVGEKPFYYYFDGDKFIFSSELKGILKHKYLNLNTPKNISKDAVDLYFSLGFVPAPYSIYKNVFKLESRQNMVFNLEKKEIKRWYYYEIPKYEPIYDKEELISEGKKILRDAVRLRMVADVPVGAFLSGGLDSSTVVGVMKEFTCNNGLHTFSIGFEEYDETPYINTAKDYFKTKHHHYYFTEEHLGKLMKKYMYIYDEPFEDYAGLPTYKLSKSAKKRVSVVLTGDGGDEIFGGYESYVIGFRMDFIRKLPKFLRVIGSNMPVRKNQNNYLFLLKEAFRLSLHNLKFFHAESFSGTGLRPKIYKDWTTEKLDYCLHKTRNKLGEASRLYDLLFYSIPDKFLVKSDRASMATALEIRTPFLDYRFIEFSQKIPTEWKIDFFKTKKLMREIIKDILPKEILYRDKQGFAPALQRPILKKYESFLAEYLGFLKNINPELYDFFQKKVFKENNEIYNNYKIRLFLFGLWYEKWIT